jgi:hypothetical protein
VCNMTALLPAFVLCHDVVNILIIGHLARDWTALRSSPVPVWLTVVIMTVCLTVLSALWTAALVDRTRGTLQRARKVSASPGVQRLCALLRIRY